jgi:hypothetical protein
MVVSAAARSDVSRARPRACGVLRGALQEFIERTRGLAEPSPQASLIPRSSRCMDD